MSRPVLEADDRLLTAEECAERAKVPVSAWWGIARDNLGLRRSRVVWRGRTTWLASGVARFLRSLAGSGEEQERGAAGRAALRARRAGRHAQVRTDHHLGACPECGGSDGVLNVGRDHWGACHAHRTKWYLGSNLFSSWREEEPATHAENERLLGSYTEASRREVAP